MLRRQACKWCRQMEQRTLCDICFARGGPHPRKLCVMWSWGTWTWNFVVTLWPILQSKISLHIHTQGALPAFEPLQRQLNECMNVCQHEVDMFEPKDQKQAEMNLTLALYAGYGGGLSSGILSSWMCRTQNRKFVITAHPILPKGRILTIAPFPTAVGIPARNFLFFQ